MKIRIKRIISAEEWLKLTQHQRKVNLAMGVRPSMAGADGEGDGDGDDGGAGDDGGKEHGGADGDDGDDGEHDRARSGSGGQDDGGDDDDDDHVKMPKGEAERLRRVAADAAKAQRKAEKEARDRTEKERREAGQYEDIITEKDEEVQAAQERAEAAQYELDEFRRQSRIMSAATRQRFKDPDDAVKFLNEDDTADDVSTERALKRLAREKPYLVDRSTSTGAPITGGVGTLTMEDVKKMSSEQINARWDEVQKAMQAGNAA